MSKTVPTSSNGTPTARSASAPAEVRSRDGQSEAVQTFGGPLDPGAVLVPELVPGSREAAGRPIDHVNRSGIFDGPHVLERTPTARSAWEPLPKFPAASANPKPPVASPVSSIPGVSWVHSWFPGAARPVAEPYRTLTSPAESKEGTPMARSARPSWPKSAPARARPKLSACPAVPWIPALS